MLEMLAESFSGCVYMYVRVLWRLLASPRLASAVYCPQTPAHTPLVNGCSHPSPSSLRNRLHAPGRGQIDWCALSLQKDLNSICLQWLQFPGQPKSALFFLRLFFSPTLPGGPSFHFITLCESTCPLHLLFILRQRSACVSTCVSVCICVCPESTEICLSSSPDVTWSFYWTYAKKKKCIHVYAKTCHHGFIVCALQ